jgi:uncharacterized RDD family membrane protein YckC
MDPEPESPGYLGYYAGFISRFLAFALDIVLTMFIIVATTWFFSITVTVFQLSRSWAALAARFPHLGAIVNRFINPVTGSIVALLFLFLYFAVSFTMLGQTPGKLLLGLRVRTVEGKRLPFWRSCIRVLAYILSAVVFFLGFLWVLVDDQRQAWHDKIAGTYVVYAWRARPDEHFLIEFIDRLRRLTSSRSIHSR